MSLAWMLMQTQQKPDVGSKDQQLGKAVAAIALDLAQNQGLAPIFWPPNFPLLEADDPRVTAFWGQLQFTTQAETKMFAPGDSASNIIRQFAELSQWFPLLTPSVGAGPANNAVGIPDLNLSPYGATGFVTTHSYLYESPFGQVWQALTNIHSTLAPQQTGP